MREYKLLSEEHNDYAQTVRWLKEYFSLNNEDWEGVEVFKAAQLPERFRQQLDSLNDARLEDVNIAVIPDEFWVKSQPSESSAERQLILIKKSYYYDIKDQDAVAWLTHELAHCQKFLDYLRPEDYEEDMKTHAFTDLDSEYYYPNNLVEQAAFTRQFQFLKNGGMSKEDILKWLGNHYDDVDNLFFRRILDSVYA